MRSCPLFEHLLSPSLNNDLFQITNKQDNCMEEKYFQVKKKPINNLISNSFLYSRHIMNLNEMLLLKLFQ
jgi:hypothetical protein